MGSSRPEAEMPRLDAPSFNDRFSDWVAVEPPKAKMVETEVISVKPIELTPVTYIMKPEPEVRSSCRRGWFTVDRHRHWEYRERKTRVKKDWTPAALEAKAVMFF